MTVDPSIVSLIDDAESVRRTSAKLLQCAGYLVKTYGSALEFLRDFDEDRPGCVITDLRMPDMDGLDLLDELVRQESRLPVIIITAFGDIPTAVRAIESGAVGYLLKPYEPPQLFELVEKALQQNLVAMKKLAQRAEIRSRLDRLTPREREVMNLTVTGKRLKQIATELNVTIQTVSRHRISVMKKLGAENDMELARMVIEPIGASTGP